MEQPTEKQIAFAQRLGIEDPRSYSKDGLRIAIDQRLGTEEPQHQPLNKFISPKPSSDKSTTMYTSYAKDIFCEIVKIVDPEEKNYDQLMNMAILLVQQAKEAFS